MNEGLNKVNLTNIEEGRLTPDEFIEKIKDPKYLPKYEDVSYIINNYPEEWRAICHNDKEEQKQIFECWNDKFINNFYEYLSQRIKDLRSTIDEPLTILEVGAGDGRLSYFLQQKFIEENNVKIIAVDSFLWGLKSVFSVENLDQKKALQKYQPKIVISSWMPPGVDFTQDFRATNSVDEYILIGEPDSVISGDMWNTWGQENNYFSDYHEDDFNESDLQPPYIQSGFERVDLDEVSRYQTCRTDWKNFKFSFTVSFRRKK